MRSTSAFTASLFLLLGLSGALQTVEAQGSPELAGGWLVTSWTTAEGETDSSPQRGLFVFTATGQYSMMFVRGDEPRPRYEGETMTDEETLAAYDNFIANSGRYTVEGDRITYEAYVAKDPNYMADWNAQERTNANSMTFSIGDDGVLTLKWIDGFLAGMTATLRRPGG